ncbi:cysteine-rich DPF motif domain-containing protein 1 isoform X1 [Lutra lutra]|uniref:cysteine-rich DPF motif domain-containing protein 1 isoform X1 n=1 Tax=Lutra lutra TaxID=9657 RepID=UPI001FD1415F|nr:cysteine-rich DPF motif domain-containing protein 1 isoform X1 [Lutra lutra]
MLDALRPPGFFEGGWKIQEASESLGTAFRAGPGVLLSQEGGVTFPFRPCVAEAEVYFVEAEVLQEAPRRGGGGLAPALYVVAGRRSRAGASGRRPCCSWRRFQPPGGELRPEGPVHLRQGQVPGPRLQVQCVQPAGVRGPGGNAVYSTPRGFASPVSRRTWTPSLRKSGKTWRKGKLHQRGRPASLALGHECSLMPGWQERLAQSSGAELGAVVPSLVSGQAGAVCATGVSWGPACPRKVTGRRREGTQKADLGPDIPQTRPHPEPSRC